MTSTETSTQRSTSGPAARHPVYSALVGLASLGVLLQGLWAGLFIQEGQAYDEQWVEVHALGAEITIALSALGVVAAFVWLRQRRDLLIGSVVLTVLLVLESYIGGEIGGRSGLTAIHFPLAMALMGLAVWLPLRARSRA